jgi:FHS family L-fucose permease-like MFS transporter
MAIVGGAALTPIMGVIPDVALAMLVPLCCYVFIAWYSFVGSRLGTAAFAAVPPEG